MQNPNVKKAITAPSFQQKLKYYVEAVVKYLLGLAVSLGKGAEVAKNNFNLGMRHLSMGNYGDAVFRFKMVTWLEPENIQAWYQLGNAYLADRKPGMATSCYRKVLAMKSDHEEAAYMLAIARGSRATPDELPRKLPLSLAHSHFEALAATYDSEQLERFGYKGHALLADALKAFAVPGRIDYSVLDLGVGTGLIAPLIRPIVSQATGVDISEAMLLEAMKANDAQGKKAYDSLIMRDAVSFLKESPAGEYDMVVAGGLFSFIGELEEIFHLVSATLKSGGLFAFTTDIVEGQGYRFDPQAGRFRFSKQYLERLASSNGLGELKLEQVDVYPDHKMWLAVFKKQ